MGQTTQDPVPLPRALCAVGAAATHREYNKQTGCQGKKRQGSHTDGITQHLPSNRNPSLIYLNLPQDFPQRDAGVCSIQMPAVPGTARSPPNCSY